MMDSSEAKGLLKALGADLCGVAGMERFAQAPAGYPPGTCAHTTRGDSMGHFASCCTGKGQLCYNLTKTISEI